MHRIQTLKRLNIATFLQSQVFLFPVLLLFYQYHGLTIGDFFLFQGIYSLTRLFLEVPAGYLGDLFTKKDILLLSYFFLILRCCLLAFLSQYGYWIILTGEILSGIEKAFFSGAIDSYIYEYLDIHEKQNEMPRQYGILWAFIAAGATISSLIASWLYHIISQYSITSFGCDYGFIVLILIELVFNLSAVALIWEIPNIRRAAKSAKSLKTACTDFVSAVHKIVRNNDLIYHLIFASFLWGTASLLAWTFQPMLQTMLFPIAAYGIVYFINHLTRTIFSIKTAVFAKYISLPKLGCIVFSGFLVCFILFLIFSQIQPLSFWKNMLYFLFVSLIIAFQLVFSNIYTAYMHNVVSPNIRATASSIYSMSGQLFGGIYLILLKFLTEYFSITFSMTICLGFFIPMAVLLHKIIKNKTN